MNKVNEKKVEDIWLEVNRDIISKINKKLSSLLRIKKVEVKEGEQK